MSEVHTDETIDAPISRVDTGLEAISANIGGLDFNREEKHRLVALMLATQFYAKLIINDAEYLKVMLKNEREVHPATVDRLIMQAEAMLKFLHGGNKDVNDHT